MATNSARLTLVKGGLRCIATARALSVATVRSMKQNPVFAFAYNPLGIPLAAGVTALLAVRPGWAPRQVLRRLPPTRFSATVTWQ